MPSLNKSACKHPKASYHKRFVNISYRKSMLASFEISLAKTTEMKFTKSTFSNSTPSLTFINRKVQQKMDTVCWSSYPPETEWKQSSENDKSKVIWKWQKIEQYQNDISHTKFGRKQLRRIPWHTKCVVVVLVLRIIVTPVLFCLERKQIDNSTVKYLVSAHYHVSTHPLLLD